MDNRAEQLADLVLDYSIKIAERDRLIVQFDPKYGHYAGLLGRKAREKGAEVRYDSMTFDPVTLRGLVERSDPKELGEELERRKDLASWCNTRIYIRCVSNPDYAAGIEDAEAKVANFDKAVIAPYKKVLYRPGPHSSYEVRWNIVGFPCEEDAETAGMSPEDYTDFVYSATIGNDWTNVGESMKRLKNIFDGAKDVRLLVPGLTDLRLSLEGRGGEICDGKHNMPDGEFFYGPVEDSVNGHVYFQIPSKREGFGVLEGIRLEFRNGAVSGFSARKNQRGLQETLMLRGARRLGEFGIGCNYGIKRAILETLFDEKIGGTIHLALGQSFDTHPLSSGGGFNKSDIHWDLVCDLRKDEKNLSEFPGGEIYVDGKLVQKNGVWLV